jgi:hypothetical protein
MVTLHENVCRFNVPMDVTFSDQDFKSQQDISEHFDRLGLSEVVLLGKLLSEVAITEFENDICEVFAHLMIDHLDCVFRVDVTSNGNLSLKGLHESRIFVELFHIHLLDGVKQAVPAASNFEYLAIAALSEKNFVAPFEVLAIGKFIIDLHIF